jgi:hypothetical protein
MSVRDQEQRAREAACKADKVARRIDLRMREAVRQENQVTLRAEEVERRIEVGDVQPCPLLSLREDSIPRRLAPFRLPAIEPSYRGLREDSPWVSGREENRCEGTGSIRSRTTKGG